jgi:hypothetical protein
MTLFEYVAVAVSLVYSFTAAISENPKLHAVIVFTAATLCVAAGVVSMRTGSFAVAP